jgi:hypothetical protein
MLSKHSRGNLRCKDTLTSLTLHGSPLEGLHGALSSVVPFLNLTELVLSNCTKLTEFLDELAASIRENDFCLEHLAIMVSEDSDDDFDFALNPLFYYGKHLQPLSLEWHGGITAPLPLEEIIAKLKGTLRILSLHDRGTTTGFTHSLLIASLKRVCA